MSTLQEQIQLEKDMVGRGIARYTSSIKDAEEGGRGASTAYARTLAKHFIDPVADYMSAQLDRKGPGVRAKYRVLLKGQDPHVLAYVTITALMNKLTDGEAKSKVLLTICNDIGAKVHDDIKFSAFREQHGDYYDAIINDFKRKGTKQYRHMHRVLTKKAGDMDVSHINWSRDEINNVGMFAVDAVVNCGIDLIVLSYERRGNKTPRVVKLSDSTLDWIAKHTNHMKLVRPDAGPMLIEPDPWIAPDQGGFYTPQMRQRHKFIKHKHKASQLYLGADLSRMYDAVNRIQATPWKVNVPVYEALIQVWEKSLGIGLPESEPIPVPACPIEQGQAAPKEEGELMFEEFMEWKRVAAGVHNAEKERKAKGIQLSRVMRLAGEYKTHESLWFVNQCDFRGRVYPASPAFNPQGADFAKGLLTFAKGKRLGSRGWYWLKVHGANKYGFDKVSYDDRVAWIDEQHSDFIACADDPIRWSDVWRNADKPYQYLAFIMEYAEAAKHDPYEYVSHLPVALDGSCNGLQHFSALLSDAVGGESVNLINNTVPSDIYGAVAAVLEGKLRASDEPEAKKWLEFGIDRHLCKKPVMTLPYGSTRSSCTESILAEIIKRDRVFFGTASWRHAQWITGHLWSSIGEVVIAARSAMKWLRVAATVCSRDNSPIIWTSPIGLPVIMANTKIKTRQVKTLLLGTLSYTDGTDTNEIDAVRQRSGLSPNFVHALDASHMMMVVEQTAPGASLAMIHDDFGTHGADIDRFHEIIREQFVAMYKDKNALLTFKEEVEFNTGLEFEDLPTFGDLNIDDVLSAKYFFG